MKLTSRIKHAWNALTTDNQQMSYNYGPSSSRPSYKSYNYFSMSSFVSSIYNRIAIDGSMTKFSHVKIDPKNDDITDMNTGLNNCLTTEANIDQTHIQFLHDLIYSMFDEGVVAVVPVNTNIDPNISDAFDIISLRVGKIVNWFPRHVEIRLYNEINGQFENVTLEKKFVAIIENPLYAVINGENSTLKRLTNAISKLDNVDELANSGRLDLLISVPYAIKTPKQQELAEERIKNIESQLASGRNGIAYIDGTEKVVQLNRPLNPQLLEKVNTLTQQLYNQLGLTKNIFDGTASELELRTYYSRTIDPIIKTIIAEFSRKFLTKTGRTQGQAIQAYRDMFSNVPVEDIAKLGDTLRRNYIATANEMRKIIGLRPSNDPRADELFNPNIGDNKQIQTGEGASTNPGSAASPDNNQNGDNTPEGGG